jgi:hypothetical protein
LRSPGPVLRENRYARCDLGDPVLGDARLGDAAAGCIRRC